MHEFMIYQKSICNKTRLRHNIKILDSKYKHLCNHPPRTSISNEHMLFFLNPPSGGAMLFLFFSPASQVILDAEQRSRESSLTPGSLQWFLPRHLQAIHLGGPTQHVAFCCFFVSTSSFKQKNTFRRSKPKELLGNLLKSWTSSKNGGDVSWQWRGYSSKWECYECAIIRHSYKKWSYW